MNTRDDLLARAEPWLQQCGSCDAGLATSCTCPPGDVRSVLLDLVRFVEASRPRVVTTAAELDEMTNATLLVVATPCGPMAVQKESGAWYMPGDFTAVPLGAMAHHVEAGSVTVVWSPPAETNGGTS